MLKRILGISIILCLSINSFLYTHAAEEWYMVEEITADGTINVIDKAQSYTVAKATYDAHEANTHNIQIRHGDDVLIMKYGVVYFRTSDTCDYNVTYQSAIGDGYTNGCYGADAAYIGDGENGFQDFYISGIHGSTSGDDVTLQPIETAAGTSRYQVREGKLYHQIKTDQNHDLYGAEIFLGEAPDYLQDEQSYYSYDGHYFYPINEGCEGFHQMIDDLKAGTFTHSINAAQPFYQYFQYLSHRSTTSYSAADIEKYFSDTLHINHSLNSYRSIGISRHAILTQSLLKDSGSAFLFYQDRYGANALMMLSLAMNESAAGRSYLAYTRNNLFGHAAFDSAVEENASRYQSVSASIRSHALHYIHESYANPDSTSWHGAHFGNKASGMNVTYASDPYWGEKAAQYYERIDAALGGRDKNAQALGVITKTEVKFYEKPNTDSEVRYTNGKLTDFPVLILAESDDFYQIQSDQAADEQDYDFDRDVVYVAKQDVKRINDAAPAPKQQRYEITFDAQAGRFDQNDSTVTLKLAKGQIPAVPAPARSDYRFSGWDHEIEPVSENTTYTAKYQPITAVEWEKLPKQTYQKGEALDVSDGLLSITTADEETQELALNTAMVTGYDPDQTGTQTLTVNDQGVHITYEITVQDDTSIIEGSQEQLHALLDQEWSDPLSDQTKSAILAQKQRIDTQGLPPLTADSLRRLDALIQKAYGSALQIRIFDEGGDIGVSGLSVAMALNEPSFWPQTLRLTWRKGIAHQKETLLTQVAEGIGYHTDYCFSLSGGKDMDNAPLQSDIVVTLPKSDHPANYTYLILRYEDGEVIQTVSQESANRIAFITDTFGDYALISRPDSAVNTAEDRLENNSVETNPPSLLEYGLWIIAGSLILLLIILTCIVRRRRAKKRRSKAAGNDQSIPHDPRQSPSDLHSDDQE